MDKIPSNIIRFIGLILLQALVLNNIDFGPYIHPYLYVMALMMLPFTTPVWLVMLIGFFAGLSLDMFTTTIGLHASTGVFVGMVRQPILRLIAPRNGYDPTYNPTMQDYGFQWYITFTLFMVSAHHTWYFFIEYFKFSEIPFTLLKIILSSIVSLVLISLAQFLLYRPKKQK